MALLFRRNLTGPTALEPGEYFVDIFRAPIGQAYAVHLKCACAAVSQLAQAVAKGGVVSERWTCGECGAHEWLVLDGFGEPT
jgi:ribosomal protein S27AE